MTLLLLLLLLSLTQFSSQVVAAKQIVVCISWLCSLATDVTFLSAVYLTNILFSLSCADLLRQLSLSSLVQSRHPTLPVQWCS